MYTGVQIRFLHWGDNRSNFAKTCNFTSLGGMIFEVGLFPYSERLGVLKLTTLIERRTRGDLIEVFKSKKDLSNINGVLRFGRSGLNIISKSNGSAKLKTFKRNFINERVKSFWNQLPSAVKNSLSLNCFKSGLEDFKNKCVSLGLSGNGNFWELSGEVLKRIEGNDYIENKEKHNEYLKLHPFVANDGALLFENICRKTYLSIKIEMLTIIKWLSANKLSLNVDKTKLLILDNAKFSVKIKLNNNYAIKECKSFKYLGLMVDNNLKFDIHVDYIKKKIQKRIGAMYRGSSLLPVKYRKMFANSLILPHFDYLDTIYGRASKTKLHELDVLYKKVAKIALGVEKTESSINVYKDMKWLPLHFRRQVHLSSYMLKILNGQSPSNFINKFKFISGGSRDGANCNLYTPKSKNLKNFYYLGAKAWNSLPIDLRNMSDRKVFGKNFKSRLLDSVINDPNYIVNNAYDYIHKLKN